MQNILHPHSHYGQPNERIQSANAPPSDTVWVRDVGELGAEKGAGLCQHYCCPAQNTMIFGWLVGWQTRCGEMVAHRIYRRVHHLRWHCVCVHSPPHTPPTCSDSYTTHMLQQYTLHPLPPTRIRPCHRPHPPETHAHIF